LCNSSPNKSNLLYSWATMTPELAQTIANIYDAVDDVHAWPEVIGQIAKLLTAEAGGLSFEKLPAGSSALDVSYGFEASLVAEYNSYYHSVNILLQRARPLFVEGAVISSHDICPDSLVSRSEYYTDCLRKWGLFYILGGVVAMSPHSAGLAQFLRAKRYGPFTAEEKATLGLLNKHLNRALRMQDAAATVNSALETLDHVGTAAVLLSRNGRIVYTNRAASEILKRRDGLVDDGGILAPVFAPARSAFRTLIAAQLTGDLVNPPAPGPDALKIERSSGKRAYSLLVSPIRASSKTLFDGHAALVVFIRDPDKSANSDWRRLRQLHGLTPAEAKLAAILMAGSDLTQACETLRITRNTGRAHLRSVFSKLDVKRQSELVSVLLRSLVF